MKKLLLNILLFFSSFCLLVAQNTLFDQSKVSSVYISIDPDSLEVILTDVLSDHYYKALFVYDDGENKDTVTNIGFRLRGNTSRYAQKKSFKISFNEYQSGRRYQGVKKINLNGQHNDPTMVREKLFYDTWAKAGMPERRTSFVRLYINAEYFGLYTNLEEMDKDWLDRVYGENDGNLYKCTYPADLVYAGTLQETYKNIESGSTTGGRAYDLQTNEAEDDYSDLVSLIYILNQPADDVFAAAISARLDVPKFLKAYAIDVATGNWDDYMYNKNNYFLYHHPDTDMFEFISYDTDNTFGVDWVNRDWATRNCLDWHTHSEPRPLSTKILAIPAFYQMYVRYLDTIARQIISPNVIFSHIDSLKMLINDAAATDTYRTLDYGYTLADFNNGFTQSIDNHTPYGIKPFLTKRSTTILQQLPSNDITEASGSSFRLIIYPNPVSEELFFYIPASSKKRQLQILSTTGKPVLNSVIARKQEIVSIAVAELPAGVYILRIESDEGILSQKFIKR